MVDIRPQDLNPAVTPIDADSPIIIDQGLAGVNRTTATAMVNAVAPVATQAEAEVGTNDVKRMTALKTKQSISSEVGVTVASYASGQAGLSAVQSVNGKSGNSVTLVKGDVGLSNVDNTSDADKPISTAAQVALDGKLPVDGIATDSDKLGGETAQEWSDKINVGGIYDTKAAAEAANIPPSINAIRLNGGTALGDGNGGLYSIVNNGSTDVVVSGGRTFYRVKDVSRDRLSVGLHQAVPYATNGVAAVRALPTADLLTRQRANTFNGEYIYNPALKLSDNGVTVLKPNDNVGDGRWVMQGGVFNQTFTVTYGNAGSGADFTDLTEALAFCSKYYPEYTYGRGRAGRRIDLRILAGTIVDQGICAVDGQQLGHVRIISDDPIVMVNFPTNIWWCYGEGGTTLPRIATIFDLQGIGYDGLALKFSSKVVFEYETSLPGYAGIINAARHNVFINTDCHASLRKGVFTGAGENGIHLEKGCRGTAREADVSNAGGAGIFTLSSCYLDAHLAVAQNCSLSAIRANLGGEVAAYGIDASNCTGVALYAENGAKIVAPSANLLDSSDLGAYAKGGEVIVNQASYSLKAGKTVNGNFMAVEGGRMDCRSTNLNGAGASIANYRVLSGSIMQCYGTTGSTSLPVNTLQQNGIIFK